MTHMRHTFSGPDAAFDHNLQLAQFVNSAHAEFCIGIPITG